MAEIEIKLNMVGVINTGKYAGWYIFVRPHEPTEDDSSYTVYVCTDTTFAFNPAERECYDSWAQNMPSLEGLFERHPDVRWDENITPPKFGPPSPEMQRLSDRLRERMNKTPKDNSSDEA